MTVTVPSGYKQTKIGIIPEDWDVVQLGDYLINFRLGGNYTNTEIASKFPLIKMGNLNRGRINLTKLDYIKEGEKVESIDRIQYGDLFFNTRNTLDLVGKVAIWRDELPEAYYNSNLMYMKFDNNFFMNYKFNSVEGIKALRRIATGTTSVAAIYTKDLIKIKLTIPPLKEQQKIAQILTTWDDSISKQGSLIKAKEELKKGLMQKLLRGEIRFDGFNKDWEEVKLEKVLFHEARPVEKPKDGYWRLGLRSHAKGTFHTFVEDPKTVSMDTLYVVKENDLIVNITFAWEHALALASKEDEGKLVSHRFPTYVFKSEYAPTFFKYYMLRPRFKYELVNISPGGAGRNRVMSKKDFLKIKITVPSLKEQEKIAEVLSLADKELNLLKQELFEMKEQKKGLMQKLLTGQVRVSV